MSWDLYVQDWGEVNKLTEIPDDFKPKPIGLRSEIIKKILEVAPMVDFSNPSWGRLETDQFSIEFNMGEKEELKSFAMHVYGSELAVPCIGAILERLELKAADGGDEGFFDIEKSKENMAAWIEYRNYVLGI